MKETSGKSEKQVIPYDFKAPNRLSKEQIRRLEYLHSSFVKKLSLTLTGKLRDMVTVEISSVEEKKHSAFIESLPVPGATFTFESETLEGSAILNIDLRLAFAFIDRLFGGRGVPIDDLRELTAIEQAVVVRIARVTLKEVESAWNTISETKLKEPVYVPSPEFIPSSGFEDSVICARLKVSTEKASGDFVIGYPYLMFEPLIKKVVKGAEPLSKRPDKRSLEAVMAVVSIPISARIPESRIRIAHLARIDVGDVLLLDRRVGDEVVVLAGDKEILMGRPGRSHGNMAVKVTRVLKEGGQEHA